MKKIGSSWYGMLCAMAVPLFTLLLTGCLENVEAPPETVISDDFVDLRPQQTALRNQGGRGTCIVFAGVAALEASYRRYGYGEPDLSEEFINFTRKSAYLHPIWDDHMADGVHRIETQLGSTGGGGGVGVVVELSKGYKIPLEEVMGYHDSEDYYKDNFPALTIALDKGAGATQKEYSDFNLDPEILTHDILHNEDWYGVAAYRNLDDATDTDEIETILKSGKEVVWDFSGSAPWDEGGVDDRGVWQECGNCNVIAHSMLIVGFDKRDSDPSRHYFMVKNSWGEDESALDLDGYTAISYDYVRRYGLAAAYIQRPAAISEWPEIAFFGRWKLNYDGLRGTLDIYHLPGMADYVFEYNYTTGAIPIQYNDYRIGTFYDSQGNPYRVNGSVLGNKITFYIDNNKPLLRWDEVSGRKFEFYLRRNDFMAGQFTDTDGNTYGGYASKGQYSSSGGDTPRPFGLAAYYESEWYFSTEGAYGELYFDEVVSDQSADHVIIEGRFTSSWENLVSRAQIKFYNNKPHKVYLQIAKLSSEVGVVNLTGHHHTWDSGLITGKADQAPSVTYPFKMTRIN
ncbi:C1 family peptidase [Roseivirga sp. BDSF3-8]|uniref:C1 family peptidase n=1 Tax=Roseivirga sp. BDSF3-8 TaxID=3241598 RepID=UPI003531F12F